MGILDRFIRNKNKLPEKRREKNNKYIKKMGIVCCENLPEIQSSDDVKLKDIDTICKRAIACLLSIQFVFEIESENNYDEAKKHFSELLKKYDVENKLLRKEQRLFNNQYNKQDIADIVWNYEAYWSLVWVLGLINDIKVANNICDCKKAIALVEDCSSFEDFKGKCKIRNIEDILDMLDLYYRYHWACVEKRINPNTNIGNLNGEVVWERRKGLEWVISKEHDWDDISLDT